MNNLVIITGATGGLGRSYVNECASRGYDLILSGTNQQRLDNLKQEISAKYNNIKIYAKACNLSLDEDRNLFYEYLKEQNLVPNMLINNAGYILEGSFLGCREDEIVNAIKVNCVGTVDFTYKFLKQRDINKKNYILFVTSLAAFYPMPQMSVYSSSKSMLTRFAMSIRRELKGQVNISVVCPGAMATNKDMCLSIESQGLGGKLSTVPTEKIAKKSVNKLLKNKARWIPGFFNKFTWLTSKLCSEKMIASFTYKRWVKAEKKRGQYR